MGSDQIETQPLLFLHGFWGQASDWTSVLDRNFIKKYEALSYTENSLLSPENFLSDWGSNFINWKKQNFLNQKMIAVGYSQGGRLLLQAFNAAPEEFEKIILISSHPGLENFEAKESRLLHDRKWAQKFRTQSWEQLQSEWDSQSVFKNKSDSQINPKRIENQFDRETLALCLENWSLAHQPNSRDLINQYIHKFRIILGENDSKYIQLYQSFLKDLSILKIEKGAAHRVPFDQPTKLVETLNSII